MEYIDTFFKTSVHIILLDFTDEQIEQIYVEHVYFYCCVQQEKMLHFHMQQHHLNISMLQDL